MGSYVKSIDKQHLVGIGMEGFYGDSSPNKIKANPGSFKFGTDFITNNLNKAIDFATIHAYPDAWLVSSSSYLLFSILITLYVFFYTQKFEIMTSKNIV